MNRKKRILFLVQLPPPVHGASVVNKTIMDSKILNAIFETELVNISPASEMSDLGKISFRKMGSSMMLLFHAISRYINFKPDLVYLTLSPHGPAFYKDGLLAILLRLLGGKLIFHMHGKGIDSEASKSKLRQRLYRLVFKKVDIIHLSEALFYDLASVRDKARSITAVANSVKPSPDLPQTRRRKKITFIYLSNLMPSKGADILVRAACMLPSGMQESFGVRIIGSTNSSQYTQELEELAAGSSYKNIELLGSKYDDDKYAELLSSHVFVLPTRFKNECFPLSILEAMSAGLAVISADEGAITDIVDHGITGEVLNECSPEALADIMHGFIQNPGKAYEYGAAGKAKYQQFYTHEIFEGNLVKTLKRVLNENEARAHEK